MNTSKVKTKIKNQITKKHMEKSENGGRAKIAIWKMNVIWVVNIEIIFSTKQNLVSVHKNKSLQVLHIVRVAMINNYLWRFFGREYTITRNPKSIGTADTSLRLEISNVFIIVLASGSLYISRKKTDYTRNEKCRKT